MADPKHITEEEPDEKTKRDREEARQRRLEHSLEQGLEDSRIRSGQRHSAGTRAPQDQEKIANPAA
jgi:hypothetical protein